ncbi:mannose-binding protein c [Plakobranchus ocellatus]|uniref:Mannose-binding protein c n=1 Tax=Plakobranchus ocellatus TaxID=259542 RepID=A0AAV4CVJ2_9GAST|nr:mannose-binding protein c [Plakobranchus ocellatus]
MSLVPIFLLLVILMIGSVQGYVSYDYKWRGNRKYYISREHESFNLAKMNGRCKQLGGYLVQIDSREEHELVQHITNYVNGRGPFFTGITDEESEGRFYSYNDKRAAKYLDWRYFQPDNWWNEDCVAMGYHGLNDLKCGNSGRYVCEVPV